MCDTAGGIPDGVDLILILDKNGGQQRSQWMINKSRTKKRRLQGAVTSRMSRGMALAAFLIVLFPAGCAVQTKWRSATFFVFDTICEVSLFSSREEFRAAQEDIHRIFSEIDLLFSPDAKNFSSDTVRSLFRRALEVHRASEGCFDIAVAPLSKLWGFWDGEFHVPPPGQISNAVKNVGMEKIQEEKSALQVPPGFGLDWGGIAKGLGIDLAAQSLKTRGISRGFINAGGDLFCWGKNPSQNSWKIGIKHPRQEGFFGVLEISDVGAATAGDYQRFFIEEGFRYHHIFDPRTGYPASGKQSVTVIGPETLLCDALSTALFVSSQPERIINQYPQYGAVIMDNKGQISILGKGFPFQPVQ